ncbi:hypothetical protein GP486_008028 [Trichoglossum hirsutum]|uniref:Rhodopsin domain-containing protein n=1 Tax=Trichoglossum hirsutum TaxID=265104 RepID=A0A9P8IGN6_9PEZI|nr:hypothetical protein GP486_008028 [Trichoglossum hirsutum]
MIAIRLTLRVRRQIPPHQVRRYYSLDASDILCIVSVPFLVARWTLAHILIVWGTNNIAPGKKVFAPGEVWRREMGSKCVLGSRVTFATFVWIMKAVLLLFYHRLIHHTSWGRPILRLAWFLLFASYVSVQVTTFTECHPFKKYYVVSKNPDKCVKAITQLFVLGILSIFTDVMLILLPIPVLSKIRQPLRQLVAAQYQTQTSKQLNE